MRRAIRKMKQIQGVEKDRDEKTLVDRIQWPRKSPDTCVIIFRR